MPQPETNVWLAAFTILGGMASVATWVVLLQHRMRGPILEYLPRRPVPWGPAATLLAVLLVVLAFATLSHTPEWMDSEFTTTYDLVQSIALSLLQILLLTGVFCAIVVAASRASLRDLGLPEYADELGRDIRIGAVACLAALVPVFCVQALLIRMVEQPTQHPLVQMVFKDPHAAVMVLSFLAAVVVAPICEEITFRLLLQGWLEKWEDRIVSPPADVAGIENLEEGETRGQEDKEIDVLDTSPFPPVPLSPCLATTPPSRGILGLPHGWVPILVSSLLFSLAHVGHGFDPVPLFLLAVILGYMYQRTHHIVPCIVTHMLFNLLTLIALGLTIYAS
jgi:membrane protease YdiL (CAAX protease family)